jgi:hypothetical protein
MHNSERGQPRAPQPSGSGLGEDHEQRGHHAVVLHRRGAALGAGARPRRQPCRRRLDWIEQLAAGRDDRAELVAHHLGPALDLREALRNATDPPTRAQRFSAGPGTRGAAAAFCPPGNDGQRRQRREEAGGKRFAGRRAPTAAAVCSVFDVSNGKRIPMTHHQVRSGPSGSEDYSDMVFGDHGHITWRRRSRVSHLKCHDGKAHGTLAERMSSPGVVSRRRAETRSRAARCLTRLLGADSVRA